MNGAVSPILQIYLCQTLCQESNIYELYAQRWYEEIFFNLIKNVLTLENIISQTPNGIMIEIYSALIYYLLTRIVIALAAQKANRSIHEFSFERSHKLIHGFLKPYFHLFLHESLQAVDRIFQRLVDLVAAMGIATKLPKMVELNRVCFILLKMVISRRLRLSKAEAAMASTGSATALY